MKDAYSFDTDWASLDRSYWKMYDAYKRIFQRLELNYRAVEADAGAIGGEGETHEFMALADIGEDTIASCSSCDYAANLEKAASGIVRSPNEDDGADALEKIHTPAVRTIAQLVEFLQIEAQELIKTLIYLVDCKSVVVLVRGDHDVNEIKVKNHFGAEDIALADSDTAIRAAGAPVGFAGPIGLEVPIVVDTAVAAMRSGITGANEQDYHIRNVRPGRDFELTHVGDFRNVVEGDPCPQCTDGTLQFSRGIEVGHVFKLGTKYSEKLGARYLDSNGREQVMIMGCYGIGVSRILSAIVEQNHDSNGMIWPNAIAPFHVHIIPVSVKDQTQMSLAEQLYQRLRDSRVEVLLDDRDERPGIKFKDSDLIGIPYRIVVGKQADQGVVEFKERRNTDQSSMAIEEVLSQIIGSLKG
jgi:prolyl-tRNA synthetase